MSDNRTIFRASSLVAAGSLLGVLLGLGREILFGKTLGAGEEYDAYLISLFIPALLADVFSTAITPALLPTFSRELEHRGEAAAFRHLGRSLTTVLSLVLPLAALIFWQASRTVNWVAPGAPETVHQLSATLVRVTLCGGILGILAGFVRTALEAERRFFLSALQPILVSGTVILGILAAARSSPESSYDVRIIAWSMVSGHALVVLAGLSALGRRTLLSRPGLDFRHPALRKFIVLALPMIAGAVLAQIRLFTDKFFGSQLEVGTISSLHYARRVVSMTHLLLGASFATVIYPFLATYAARREREKFRQTFEQGFSYLLLVLAPLLALLFVHGELILSLLFERGRFDADITSRTAPLLMFFALGILPHAVNRLASQAFFARQNSWLPMLVGIVGKIVNIGICLALVGPWGAKAIALGATADITLSCGIRLFFLRKIYGLGASRLLLARTVKVTLAAGIGGVSSWWLGALIFGSNTSTTPRFVDRLSELLVSSLILGVVYCGIVFTTRAHRLGGGESRPKDITPQG